ncbi:MAG TPA: hypothetical protein HA262_16590 [Methanosarcina sp.]|jgi:hypothetical protein|nr:hypothetical protein [Methanosarcina sp.]
MNGLELGQTIGTLVVGLSIFLYSHNKGLSLFKCILSAFGASILFYIGGAIAIYFINK